MLKVYNYKDLSDEDKVSLCKRNLDPSNNIQDVVRSILSEIKQNGDQSIHYYSKKFDGIELDSITIGKEEIKLLAESIGEPQREALDTAFKNIWKFHSTQVIKEDKVETSPGVSCWRESRAIEKVGLYVPGGTAVLPSTFLMLGIPARIAGCSEIVVCSPPQKDGKVNAYLAYCAQLLNIEKIYLVGGAQAIAAMAYGTATVPKVDKIFGPGNQYVTKAKSIIQAESQAAIDMPAGPSEVLIIADATASAEFVAADLLAQAEHGTDSQAVLVSDNEKLIADTNIELQKQIDRLPRKLTAAKAIENSYAILTSNLGEALDFSNAYAPEHLILQTDNWEQLCTEIINAGSVFLGHNSPESVGDYASGTNHTLPTSSYAKAYSGVSTDSFLKKITFQHLNHKGIASLGPAVEILAELEGLQAHKNAVSVRLKAQQSSSEA